MIRRDKDPSLKTLLIQEALAARGLYTKSLDNDWGSGTEAAYQSFMRSMETGSGWKKVKATSFADPADVRAFERCKAQGKTDLQCFAVGDNGIGKWGHGTAQEERAMAALPRDVWADAGKTGGAKLEVRYNGKTVEGILGDTMPHTKNIKNGAGIDLNPAFSKQLGLKPPFTAEVEWRWKS